MAINKVKFGNQTLIDLTDTTATADKILTGFGAYGKDGVWMDGSLVPGADDGYVYQDQDNYVVLDDDEGVGVGVTPLSVTENGTYNAGTRRAYNPVTVNVQPTLQSKSVTPTESQQTITPDSGKDGLSQVVVAGIDAGYVGSSVPRKSSADVGVSFSYTSNAVYDYVDAKITAPAGYYSSGINTANMHIIPNISGMPTQSAVTITPTEARQTAAQSRRWLTGNITVAGISSTYVGSGVPTKSSADLTISSYSVIAPAGYYSGNATINLGAMIPTTSTTSSGELWDTIHATNTQVYVNMPKGYNDTSRYARIYADAGKATTPATTITAAPAITVDANGLITATNSKTQNVTPTVSAGYVTTGTAGTITVGGTSTYQLTTKSSADLTRSGATVTVPAGYYAGDASKAVATMTLPTTTATTNTGTWKTTVGGPQSTTRYLNIPVGYNVSSAYYTIASVSFMSLPTTTSTSPTGMMKANVTASSTNRYINIPSGYTENSAYYTIRGDQNLIPENIKKDVTIFGITGTAETEPSLVAKTVRSSEQIQTILPNNIETYTYNTVQETYQYGIQVELTDEEWLIDPMYFNLSGSGSIYDQNDLEIGTFTIGSTPIRYQEGPYADSYTYPLTIQSSTGTFTGATLYRHYQDNGRTYITLNSSTRVKRSTLNLTIEILGSDRIGYIVKRNIPGSGAYDTMDYSSLSVGDHLIVVGYIARSTTTYSFANKFDWTGDTIRVRYNSSSTYVEFRPNATPSENVVVNNTVTPYYYSLVLYRDRPNAYDGISEVTVLPIPSDYVIPTGTLSINTEGTHNVATYKSVTVSTSLYELITGSVFSVFSLSSRYTQIGKGAFFGAKISLFDAPYITVIGSNAFQERSIGRINAPNVNYIYSYAFYSAKSLSYIGSMDNLKAIGGSAFAYCGSLQTVSLPNFSSDISFEVFKNCGLVSVYLPKVTKVYTGGFSYCSYLSEIRLPSRSQLQASAFTNCYRLSTVSIPEVLSVSDYAFASCSNLKKVYAPKLSQISAYAFLRCYSLSDLTLSTGISSIATSTFAYCSALQSLNFGNSVERIAGDAFHYCSNLQTINFPALTSISYYTFANCTKLESAYLPSLVSIGSYAFANCWSLSTVVLRDISGLTSSYIFSNCYNLLSLYILSRSCITLGTTNIFSSTPISNYTTSTGGVYGSIFVPASLYDAYKSALRWSTYSSRFASLTDAQISAILNS